MTTLLGVLLGFATAFSQCFAYIFSRMFVMQHRNAFWKLLLVSHLYMGLVCLLGLPFLWTDTLPPLQDYLLP
ncbi:MAG: hypothetical protein HN341_07650, partial [Verrucomicrobia bacterium]|nr:hypothetical protein [Verrucomicrobiota bacterium]